MPAVTRSFLLDTWLTATGQTPLPQGRSWAIRMIAISYGLFSLLVIASCGSPVPSHALSDHPCFFGRSQHHCMASVILSYNAMALQQRFCKGVCWCRPVGKLLKLLHTRSADKTE